MHELGLEGVKVHHFRHFGASRLLSLGIDVYRVIGRWVYGHRLDDTGHSPWSSSSAADQRAAAAPGHRFRRRDEGPEYVVAMKVGEAKQLAVDLIMRDLGGSPLAISFDAATPDGDVGKFVLDGRPARAIHHFDGWYVPINLDWFTGSLDPPVIHRQAFHWYVFAIPRRGGLTHEHYFVCDYLKIREWVLSFGAPLGRDHRDHRLWRADLRVFLDDPLERSGYFRWGDEPVASTASPSRVFELDNAATLAEAPFVPERVGVFGPGGESSAHRRLKLYVASHGSDFGMSAAAESFVEHRFRTGDRVDVMFQNHWPERTVIEIEVAGEENIFTGIHQAIKYRSLAEVEGGYTRSSATVRSLVVAYETAYPMAAALADRYEVELTSVDPDLVLAPAV